MPWGDRAVSPCVFVPGVADAGGIGLDDGLLLADGRISRRPQAPRNGLLFEYMSGNWRAVGTKVDVWYDTSGNNKHAAQTSDINRPTIDDNGLLFTKENTAFMRIPQSAISPNENSYRTVFSLVMRVKWEGQAEAFCMVFSPVGDTNGFGGTFSVNNGKWNYANSQPGETATTEKMIVGSIHSVNTLNMIFNGIKSAAYTNSNNLLCTGDFLIGKWSNAFFANAKIYNVWGYDRTLTQEEIDVIGSAP